MKTPTERALQKVLSNIIDVKCVEMSRQIAAIRKAARMPDHADIHDLSAATTRILRELETLDDMRLKMREMAIFGYADYLEEIENKGAA